MGDLVLSSGARFSGSWHKGKRQGHGIMKWADGSYYDGQWRFDKRHGHGTYRTPYARGHMYVGEWQDGVKEGRGKMLIGGGESMIGPGSGDIGKYEEVVVAVAAVGDCIAHSPIDLNEQALFVFKLPFCTHFLPPPFSDHTSTSHPPSSRIVRLGPAGGGTGRFFHGRQLCAGG